MSLSSHLAIARNTAPLLDCCPEARVILRLNLRLEASFGRGCEALVERFPATVKTGAPGSYADYA